jgi:hypothetical protein
MTVPDNPPLRTSFYGKPQLPIKRMFLLASLDLLMTAGKKLGEKKIVKADTHENTITYLVSHEMYQVQKSGKSDIVSWDPRVWTAYDPQDPLRMGEIDIKFRWTEYPTDNNRYLAVEAKRLFGKGDSLAGKYVEEGVMDFVIAKYSRHHNYGIMLGYVLIGSLEKVIISVTDAMTTRKREINEYEAFSLNNSLCIHEHTHHSTHIQQETDILITLIHLFLDFSSPEEDFPKEEKPLSGTKKRNQKRAKQI